MASWWPFGWRPQTKASAAGAAISAFNVGQPVWTERRYDQLADEAYVRNAVAHRCVKMIASAAATIPWLLADTKGREVEESPLLDLLRRPASGIGGHSLFEAFYAYLLLAGNTYLEAVAPADGMPPRELWTLRPDRTRVIPGAYGRPEAYEYEANGQKMTWQVDPLTGEGPILHLKEFHPIDDWYGLSRVDPAAYAVDRHNAASAHNKALLDNGARPSGALIFRPVVVNGSAQSAPKEAVEAAEARLKERHGGFENAGRPMVLGGNVDWQEMGISPRDMDFGAGKDDAARDICTAFGVPHILIVPGASTYNNVREATLGLYEDTVLPLVDKAVDALDAWLTPRFGDRLRLGVDLDEVPALEPRRESKRRSTIELFEKRVITRDEARDALQYEPLPDATQFDPDAQVLSALVDAYTKDALPIEMLWRYARSIGLSVQTDEELLAAITTERDLRATEEAAASLGDPGQPAADNQADLAAP